MCVVVNKEDQNSLQNDIYNMLQSDTWLLKFNTSKCKHVHLGHPTNTKYKKGENEIDEKDLGIVIDDKLKLQHNINLRTMKANQRLGMIKRSLNCMDKEIFSALFKSIVRPFLEYGSNVWSVIYKKRRYKYKMFREERPN